MSPLSTLPRRVEEWATLLFNTHKTMDKQQIDAHARGMLRNFISTLGDYLAESMEEHIAEDDAEAIIERAMEMWDYHIDV